MKFTKKLIALVSGVTLASLSAFAQEIISDPVGRIRLTVNGSIGWGFPGTTVLGAPLENAADARGVLTAVSGAILTDSTSAWVPGAFASTHYVQITSGPNVGITATVVGNTATQLTTAEDISSLLIGLNLIFR